MIKKWNFLAYVHGVLFWWAVLFIISLFIPDGGKTASALATGNMLFLFVNIPLSAFSLILKAKGMFDIGYENVVGKLSVINIIVGAVAWIFVIILMQSPKFG